jgi:CRP-like cAMP-binding protein
LATGAELAVGGTRIGAVIRNRALFGLLSAFAALNLAEWSFVTALSIYAYRVDGALAVGFVGFRFVPGALSSALLAPLVDRRSRILTLTALTRVVLLGAAAAAVIAGVELALVLILVGLDAAVAAPYRPAQARLLPSLARTPGELTTAAAGVSMVKTLSQALGALAGGVAVAVVAPGTAMAGAAVVMIAAVMLTHPLDRAAGGAGEGLAGLRAGIRAIPRVLRHREASPLVLASGLRTFVRGLWTALLVLVALHVFRLGSSGVGVFNGAAGAGAAVALPITASLIGRPRLVWPCALAFVGAGAGLSLVGLLHLPALAVIVIGVWGVAMALADATSLSLLHRLLDASMLSRTVGVMESLKLGAEGMGALLAPGLVAVFGVRDSLIMAGLPLPLMIALTLPGLRRADNAAADRGRVVALLHGVSVLRGLDMAALEDVTARSRRLVFESGVDVIRQGDPGETFYVIEAGTVEVIIEGFRVARLGPGLGFGERALLRDTPRAATVRTLEPLSVYAIDRTDFLSAITGRPAEELESVDFDLSTVAAPPETRPLWEVLSDLSPFAGVARESLDQLAAVAQIKHWPPGTAVIREGDAADGFYVVLGGRAQATVGERIVGEMLAGDSFGEIAILHGIPRTATVTAVGPLTTCRLPAETLQP